MSRKIDGPVEALRERLEAVLSSRGLMRTQMGSPTKEEPSRATRRDLFGRKPASGESRGHGAVNEPLQVNAPGPCQGRGALSEPGLTPPEADSSTPFSAVAHLIDHTLLRPEATEAELIDLCQEACRFGFGAVCVNSANVRLVTRLLEGSPVKVVAVIGFPLGASATSAKVFEARESVREGAREVDMVMNIGALKSRRHRSVLDDIRAVVDAVRPVPVKVILETSKLDDPEKTMASALAAAAGGSFVKTCTGFGGGSATPSDVALMRSVVGDAVGVKASGGVRTIEDVLALIEAGATRIGASASVAIVSGRGLETVTPY